MADRDGDYSAEDFRHDVIRSHCLSAMSLVHWIGGSGLAACVGGGYSDPLDYEHCLVIDSIFFVNPF